MSTIEYLNYVNIFFIWALALSLVWILSRMRYSFYKCIVRLKYHGDPQCYNWLMAHKYYIYSFIAVILLLCLSLFLLVQTYNGMVKIRTEFTVGTSIGLFFILNPLILSLFKRAYLNEN